MQLRDCPQHGYCIAFDSRCPACWEELRLKNRELDIKERELVLKEAELKKGDFKKSTAIEAVKGKR